MTVPYVPQEPGNPILAKDWNDMQTMIRDHITSHAHSGGEQGVKLTGDGIDPAAKLTVAEVTATTARVGAVEGPLRVTGPIVPSAGNGPESGIQFPRDPGGGGGDEAFLRYAAVAGESCRLTLGINNDLDDALVLWQAGAERLVVQGGRVGIGTSTPADALHVRGSGPVALQLQSVDQELTTLRFCDAGASKAELTANLRTGQLYIGARGSDALTVLGRNVGVQNQVPARALAVGLDPAGVGIDPGASPHAGYVRFGDGTGWRLHFGRSREASGGPLNQGPSGLLLTIRDNGNVGVGQPDPGQRLDVAGNLRVQGGMIIPAFGPANAGIQFPSDPAGGSGDLAWLRYYAVGGETTRLQLGIDNDPDDQLSFWQYGRERISVKGGGVVIDSTAPNVPAAEVPVLGQVALRTYTKSAANTWCGRISAGGDQNAVVLGEWNGGAMLGAHNAGLSAWTNLVINPAAKTAIATQTLDNDSALTVEGRSYFRLPGAAGGWDRLVVTSTNEWGDGVPYVTLGAGGANGVMLSNPHVTFRDGRGSIRYGRTNSTPGQTYWDVGLRSDGAFSFIPIDAGGDGAEKLKIHRTGETWVHNNLQANTSSNPTLISAGWSGFPDGANNRSEIANDVGGYKCLMIVGNKSSGTRKVGIWDRLDVNGTMFSTGNIGTRGHDPNGGGTYPNGWGGGVHTWDLVCEASISYQGGLGKFSSLRVKENVRPLTGALAKIDRMTPVIYDHRDRLPSTQNSYGFISEELRAVDPELVHEIDPGQPNFFAAAIRQDSLAALAIAGVQELSRRLARLEREVRGPAPAAPPAREGVELLAEETSPNKDGVREDYVAVRFTAEDDLGQRDVVRYLRVPPDLDRHEFVMGEFKRWKHGLRG
jgi:hypothetical protein